jgi:hypothetical protein
MSHIYTSASGLDTLTAGKLYVDPSNPVDGGAFNEEVLCPFSVGCADPGVNDFELFLESLTALTPGTQITVNLGSSIDLGALGVALITCDPTVSGEYCMDTTLPNETPDASCFTDSASTDGSGNHLVTIGLVNTPACATVPSTLVFSLDEQVANQGDSPAFADVSTTSGSGSDVPEPGSLLLLSLGLLATAGLYGRRNRKQTLSDSSKA